MCYIKSNALKVLEEVDMEFKGFQKLSLLDFPGKVSSIAFVGGCNFRCPFCYNRDLVVAPQSLPSIRDDDVLGYLKNRRAWLDGIVITGGEPTIQPELLGFLEEVKTCGFSVKLDTNGSNPELLKELVERGLVDYVAMDVKAPLCATKYSRAIGIQSDGFLQKIEESIDFLLSRRLEYEFRTTVVPNLLTEDDILTIAGRIDGGKRYYLQQFVPMGSLIDARFSSVVPYSPFELERIREKIANRFAICGLRV